MDDPRILSTNGSKRKPHIQLGDGFRIQFVPFYLSYVGTGRPTKTLCVTEHAPMTSLKVSIIIFIYWNESWLLNVVYAISVTSALSRTSWMFVFKQVPVCSFILLIFACVVLRKVHVHSLFTLETVGFPECLLFLDQTIKSIMQFVESKQFLLVYVHRVSEEYEKIVLFVSIFHIVF